MQDRHDLMDNIEHADLMLQHMWSTMEFAEEAIDTMDKQKYEYKYPLHLLAVLKSATGEVRALLDDSMCIVLKMSTTT